MTYETVEGLKEIVSASFEVSRNLSSKIPKEIAELRGMSSPKIRHFLNQVCSYGFCTYLEIGTWSGSTLVSALYGNQCAGIAIDNYSQFGPKECEGYNAKEEFQKRWLTYGNKFHSLRLIEDDCFSVNVKTLGNPNIFFYDGDHSEEATKSAIGLFGVQCAQPFILIVDDLELDPGVRMGLNKALELFDVKKSWELLKAYEYHMGVWVGVLEKR